LAFEVASVKVAGASRDSFMVGCYIPGDVIPKGMCVARTAPLRNIIAEAYGIRIFNIADHLIGGPGWIGSDRFEIQGKAENLSATTDELRSMLRNLLAERFKFRAHEEMREQSGYALVVGKNGPKLKQATTEDKRHNIGAFGTAPTQMEGTNSSMADLAEYLSRVFHRPFNDETGLKGRYDFKMTFVFDAPQLPSVQLPSGARLTIPLNDSALPAISGALGQLGLKLEAKKIPVGMIVIDHAEKPSEN
jgi:uncharacterized protein (TIGR03435 family)